jgi:thymidylate synthase
MAQITGLKPGTATHHITNLHIYDDQVPAFREMLSREPLGSNAEIVINPEIKTLSDVLEHRHARDYLIVSGYESHPKIIFPFSA